MFSTNGYPVYLFDKITKKFVSNYYSNSNKKPKEIDNNMTVLCLPYLGETSDRFRKKFTSFCNRHNLNVRLVFKPFKVSQYFSLKSRVPSLLHSGVIYKFCCPVDPGTTYIGRTQRHLCKRIKEHSSPLSQSAVFNHTLACTCKFSSANFTILRSSASKLDLSIFEALYIKARSPSLNERLALKGQSILLKLF